MSSPEVRRLDFVAELSVAVAAPDAGGHEVLA
jgi:hypothetical protein